jgi:uncharacterized protein (DUF1015 family)
VQTGIVAGIPPEDLTSGAVLPHEAVRPDRVSFLRTYLQRLRAASSPVACTFRSTPEITAAFAGVIARVPVLDFTLADGLRLEVWPIDEPSEIDAWRDQFAPVPTAYIADGHHRSAAFADLAATGGYGPVLMVLFPSEQLQVVEFNRVVRGFEPAAMRAVLTELEAVPHDDVCRPSHRGHLGLFYDDTWFSIVLPEGGSALPESLDPSRVERLILRPLLGVGDTAADPRVEHVPGTVPIDRLERLVGDGALITMVPIGVEEIMQVSDAGGFMPPKSTCFSPKVRSGTFFLRY